MAGHIPDFEVRLARDAEEIAAGQRLRYEVFIAEMGASGPLVDHVARLERDRFDPFCDHLLLIDHAAGSRIAGVLRIMDRAGAARAGGFYSAQEFDISVLTESDRSLLEMGRTCVDPAYRGGTAMVHFWNGLARIVIARGIEILFGTASFPGTDPAFLAQPLGWLHHNHLAPPELRVQALGGAGPAPIPQEALDRRAAMLATPALIKAYLRMGGVVGAGVHVDQDFNTTDVLLILDTARMNPMQRALYAGAWPDRLSGRP